MDFSPQSGIDHLTEVRIFSIPGEVSPYSLGREQTGGDLRWKNRYYRQVHRYYMVL